MHAIVDSSEVGLAASEGRYAPYVQRDYGSRSRKTADVSSAVNPPLITFGPELTPKLEH